MYILINNIKTINNKYKINLYAVIIKILSQSKFLKSIKYY